MSLIKCPECGNQVSDLASSCPHCGFPLSKIRNVFIADSVDIFLATPGDIGAPNFVKIKSVLISDIIAAQTSYQLGMNSKPTMWGQKRDEYGDDVFYKIVISESDYEHGYFVNGIGYKKIFEKKQTRLVDRFTMTEEFDNVFYNNRKK